MPWRLHRRGVRGDCGVRGVRGACGARGARRAAVGALLLPLFDAFRRLLARFGMEERP